VSRGNQVTSDGTWTYTYDHAGNLATKSNSTYTWTYGYDANEQMTSAQETRAEKVSGVVSDENDS
jgi:YD repeat-containing protein